MYIVKMMTGRGITSLEEMTWEVRMNAIRMLCLIATVAFVSPVYAQECSGGNGGGTDATGNQCGNPATAEAYTAVSSPQPTAKMGRVEPSRPTEARTGLTAKMSAATAKPTLVTQGTSRFPKVAGAPVAPIKTSKVDAGYASPCSGGANGGMDATGNECGENQVAEENAVIVLAQKH